MKKLVNAAKKDQIAFKSLAESLLDGQIFLDSDYFDTKFILLYATLTSTVISIIASVIMMLTLRKIATALIVLQRVASVESFESTDLAWFFCFTQIHRNSKYKQKGFFYTRTYTHSHTHCPHCQRGLL